MEKRFSKVILAVLFLSVLALVLVNVPFARAQALSVSPGSGQVGQGLTITASMSGFTPSETVNLVWGGNLFLGQIVIATGGTGSINFNIPSTALPGTFTITAEGSGSDYATASFTVLPPPQSRIQTTPTPAATATLLPLALQKLLLLLLPVR